jgi:type I restriction-modification system DNA methylase subunit
MTNNNHNLNWITNFIWGIADDVLRDIYVRGKYRDVILPMTVIRRLDAVLEPTKQAVLDMKSLLDNAGITNQDAALRLSRYFGLSERFWINLQTRYDLEVEKDRLRDRLQKEVRVYSIAG